MKTTREKLQELEAHLADATMLIYEIGNDNPLGFTPIELDVLADLRRRADAAATRAELVERVEEEAS